MGYIQDIGRNQILGIAILSWFIAQCLKIIIIWVNEHRLDFSQFFAAGGMPSSHSSFVVALSMSIGQREGYSSTLFAVAAVFSCIVMYDAAHVRLQAGKHAAMLNQIIALLENPSLNPEQRLKEILGHTPFQVLAGALLGIVVALFFAG